MHRLLPVLMVALLLPAAVAHGQDPSKKEIGKVRTELLFATNGDVAKLGTKAEELSAAEVERFARSKEIPKFKHLRRLGSQERPIWGGYKNWAQPMENSKAIMVTFQPQGYVNQRLRMDLELWQHDKMVMRADPILDKGERVYILGPKWRGGRLIITVELLSLVSPKAK